MKEGNEPKAIPTSFNPEVLKTLEPGDRVSARVYEGNFKVLYELKLVPPEDLHAQFPQKKYKE